MTKLLLPCLASLLAAGPVAANQGCPALTPGQSYPWQTNETLPGDFWADMLIDLDAQGKPLRCRIAKGNLKNELGFWFCNALMKDGQYTPVMQDGVAVPGTVRRHMRMPGKRHREADEAARKRYLAAHPDEKRCYPG
jgi:hypothetical protein